MGSLIIRLSLLCILIICTHQNVFASTLVDLQNTLQSTSKKSDILQKQIQEYQASINRAKKQLVSLENHLDILALETKLTQSSVKKVQNDIIQTNTQIDVLKNQIADLESTTKNQEELLVKVIQLLYEENQNLESDIILLFLSEQNIEESIHAFEYLSLIEEQAQNIWASLKTNKVLLVQQKKIIEDQKKSRQRLLEDLVLEKKTLEIQKLSQQKLIAATKGSQETFEKLQEEARLQRQKVEGQINDITKQIVIEKDRLKALKTKTSLQGFRWPIPPDTITAGFKEGSYTKRFGRIHTGIDVRAAAGTDIQSPKDGIITKLKAPTSKNLSYMVIDHGGVQTVYLHLSQTLVQEGDEVSQGQIVAKTGGVPGAFGTGIGLSTGPHLHFEIRNQGTPVDPLKYLP